MDNKEAMAILDKYRHWNVAQTSVSLAFRDKRTLEDDLLDARRRLIIKAMSVLEARND